MYVFRVASISVLLISVMAPAATGQQAEPSNSVGIGVGWAGVSDFRLDKSMSDVAYSARFSHRHSDRVSFVGEFAVFGMHDEDPSSLDVIESGPGTIFLQRPAILETRALLFSVQVGRPREMFIRPGAGISTQRLALVSSGTIVKRVRAGIRIRGDAWTGRGRRS